MVGAPHTTGMRERVQRSYALHYLYVMQSRAKLLIRDLIWIRRGYPGYTKSHSPPSVIMGDNPAPGCLLLQLLQKDDDETLRELCRRDSVAGMVQALDAQGGNRDCAGASSAAWTATARLVLDTLATVGVAVDDHHATPPLDEYALEMDEADRRHSARLRLTTIVKRSLGYERYLHTNLHRPTPPGVFMGVHFGHADEKAVWHRTGCHCRNRAATAGFGSELIYSKGLNRQICSRQKQFYGQQP